MTTDAVLKINPGTQAYDFSIDQNGDIETDDFFDTSLLYSIFGERRASSDEVADPRLRRGWIGNSDDFENGSKIWLFSQSRLTRDTLNRIEDEAQKALQWLVDDGFAVSIDQVTATLSKGRINLDITIRRSRDRIVRRFFVLWENTGRAN
jgi:phage gp46-like protein